MCLYLLERVDEARTYYQKALDVGRELDNPSCRPRQSLGWGW